MKFLALFSISKFSDQLLNGLNILDNWPNKVKTMQKNWIGKSFGCEINFKIDGKFPVKQIKCFTTRPDTLFGFSFLAVSVDHPISEFFNKDILIGLAIINPIYFICMMVGAMKTFQISLSVILGATLGPIFYFLSAEWCILFGGFTAGTIAFLIGEKNGK